jgi:ActR/RegA family two-component response regulator
MRVLKPEWLEPILRSIVQQAGAVDGVLGHAALSVDGLSWPAYASRLEEIEAIVCNAARQ